MTQALKIEEILTVIKATISPRKVILFGSAARGTETADSDIDVLVVVTNGTHRRKTTQAIYRAFFDKKIDCAVDVVVATEDDLIDHKDDFWTVIYPALRDGKTLYAA